MAITIGQAKVAMANGHPVTVVMQTGPAKRESYKGVIIHIPNDNFVVVTGLGWVSMNSVFLPDPGK